MLCVDMLLILVCQEIGKVFKVRFGEKNQIGTDGSIIVE